MGQATVDLPDPQRSPLPSAGADDLLAQMAGAEIDRLLAEAESGDPPEAQPPASLDFDAAANASVEPAVTLSSVTVENDRRAAAQVHVEGSSTPASPVAAMAPPADKPAPAANSAELASSDDSLANELDSLLDSLTTATPPVAEPAPVPPAQAVEAEEAAAIPALGTPAAPSVETAEILSATEAQVAATGELSLGGAEETSVAERSALASDAATIDALTAEVPATKHYQSFQFLLKPLEWINAPIASYPDLFREFIGKAAILTVVNAVALIVYVHFIRRH